MWAAGFCRYLVQDPTAEDGQDAKRRKLRWPWLLLARATAGVDNNNQEGAQEGARPGGGAPAQPRGELEETSHEPSARVTRPETGTRVRIDFGLGT